MSTFSVCDDVRLEVGNRFTIIGFYSKSIALPALPTTLPKLAFFAQFDSPSLAGHDLVVRLINPSGGLIFESPRTGLPVPVEDSPFPSEYRTTTIVFQVAPLALNERGAYTVQYELSDWPPYKVQFFVALQPAISAPGVSQPVQ
ncbi:MAG TPA: hypothetical protein VE377_20525 [Candidatus Dormibacteraeota bacterium]|nr:hypothetical protein [Candidatus Dormibacteraeota bacterium]